tara:strand:- start:311 stop:856 length:546 start_codon:yes stop_codon:yes gene_type:complete
MKKFDEVALELEELSREGLSAVSKLALKMRQAQEKLLLAEELVKNWKAIFREISEEQLPEAMAELNLSSLDLEDGSSISVSRYYSASIPKDKQNEAFTWLVDNKHGDLIKNQVSVNFVRGEELKAQEFADELIGKDLAVNTRKWVEPMTLKAFCKGQTEKGNHIPNDLFGLYIGNKAKLKQ